MQTKDQYDLSRRESISSHETLVADKVTKYTAMPVEAFKNMFRECQVSVRPWKASTREAIFTVAKNRKCLPPLKGKKATK